MTTFAALLALSTGASPEPKVNALGDCVVDDCSATVLRVSGARILDPHFFAASIFTGCTDVTDKAPAGKRSANEDLAFAMEEDDDRDGFADLSVLLEFVPAADDSQAAISIGRGLCRPDDPTRCYVDSAAPVTEMDGGWEQGECFVPDPEALSPAGYEPPVPTVAGACWRLSAQSLPFEIGDTELTLTEVEIGLAPDGERWMGVMRGFVSLEQAHEVEARNKPLARYLPGGDDVCADHSDLDMVGGETGWWFYIEIDAIEIALEPEPSGDLAGAGC